MAYICYAQPNSCQTCPHYRMSAERIAYACFDGFDNQCLLAHAEARVSSLSYKDVIGKTIVDIYTLFENGTETRHIHFMAYGYRSDSKTDDKDHRFLEYTFFTAPLQKVLDYGVVLYESDFGCESKQYIEDCTADVMLDRYLHYDAGKCPLPIPTDKLDINIPDGLYILL